jgi:hypothetical protein
MKKKSELRIHAGNVDRAYDATRLRPAGTAKEEHVLAETMNLMAAV